MFTLYVLGIIGVIFGMQQSQIGAQQSVLRTCLTALVWPILLGDVVYHKFEDINNKGAK